MNNAINTFSNTNLNLANFAICSKRVGSVCRFRPHSSGVRTPASGYPRTLISRFNSPNRSVSSLAASNEDSKPSDIEIEEEPRDESVEEDSEEAWKQALASFKQQALKMPQEVKKASVVLKETSQKLKIQADKATHDLSLILNDLSEDGKLYLSSATENSPESVKDIVETFASSNPDELKDVSKVLDFYVGIPYGGLLTLGGFVSFMITGSISAIRFGVILGGTLLGLAVYSLRSWKKGESTSVALKGQAAIATILFLRDLRLVFSRPTFTRYSALIISGAVLSFYVYRIIYSRGQSAGDSSLETDKEN